MKTYLRQNRAITLITLVITIIVLLILAGIIIASLTGENGLLNRAAITKEEERGAAVKEEINLWNVSKTIDSRTGTSTGESISELLDRLESQNLISSNENTKLKAGETILIGSKQISLEESDLQKLKNYFTPENGTRTINNVWSESSNTWINIEGNNMPDLNMLKAGIGGENYIIVQYNDNFYKIIYDENEIFENVIPYTINNTELGSIIFLYGELIGDSGNINYYKYGNKYYKIYFDDKREVKDLFSIVSVEEYIP